MKLKNHLFKFFGKHCNANKLFYVIIVIVLFNSFYCIDKTQPLPNNSTVVFENKVDEKNFNVNKQNSFSTIQKEITIKDSDLKGIVYEYKFKTSKQAMNFFNKEIPQRPISFRKEKNIQLARSKTGLWMIKNNIITYIIFYFENREWSDLNQNDYIHYQNIIKNYEQDMLNLWLQ